ncbi:unnamed protein product, partial [Adineta steineri]
VAVGVGQTVAGYCNATIDGSSNGLVGPWGIYVSPFDGTLYVADFDGSKLLAYAPFSRTGLVLLSTGLVRPEGVFVDSSGTIYMTDESSANGTLYIQRGGINLKSIPAVGQSTSSCNLTGLYSAHGVAVDRSGNIYVTMAKCNMIVKWVVNGTSGVRVAGNITSGTTSELFNWPGLIHLDEDRGALYVPDALNNRIQRFMIGGNGTGETVAGNNGIGTALNQLNYPTGIWVTYDGQTLYIADNGNHRVMKWQIGATQGSVVAGSANGTPGNTNQLLNSPGSVALDPSETYIYVSDSSNYRVQRFRLR